MVTKEDGRFNFEDVSFTVDYDSRHVTRTVDGHRKLSQYDHTAKVVRILTVPDTSASTTVDEAKKAPIPKSSKLPHRY